MRHPQAADFSAATAPLPFIPLHRREEAWQKMAPGTNPIHARRLPLSTEQDGLRDIGFGHGVHKAAAYRVFSAAAEASCRIAIAPDKPISLGRSRR